MANRKIRSRESQGSLFEEDFLLRTLGDHVHVPDVALTELVANAWDAGAFNVALTIPADIGGTLTIADDGCGLTRDEFFERRMTLAYNRQKHQGSDAEAPTEHPGLRRRAYGRNGQGRHSLLCFGDTYQVVTWRDGKSNTFSVRSTQGAEALHADLVASERKPGHGTALSVAVQRKLPNADEVQQVLSSRFLYDPNFVLTVNGESLQLVDLAALADRRVVTVSGPENGGTVTLEVFSIEGEARRNKRQSGVAFWVGGRLVGEPGWIVAGVPLIDGRTKLGRRFTFVVKSDDLFEVIESDWSAFKRTPLVNEVMKAVEQAVREVLSTVMTSHVQETATEALAGFRDQLADLSIGNQVEVVEVVESVARENPLMPAPAIASFAATVISTKRASMAHSLIQKIMQLPEGDQEGLNRLLDEWTVRDALTVLDEIGKRIRVVEMLEKLVDDSQVDEVHVIHPLVTEARWLFGPEYESPLFASNVSLRNAITKVFGQQMAAGAFENARRRIDLVFLRDSTLSAVATEDVDERTKLATLRSVLLIELKKGGARIGRAEMSQAEGYVEDIIHCGLLDGTPHVTAFVVGRELNEHYDRSEDRWRARAGACDGDHFRAAHQNGKRQTVSHSGQRPGTVSKFGGGAARRNHGSTWAAQLLRRCSVEGCIVARLAPSGRGRDIIVSASPSRPQVLLHFPDEDTRRRLEQRRPGHGEWAVQVTPGSTIET